MRHPRRIVALLSLCGGVLLTGALARGADRLLREDATSGGDPAGAIAGLAAGAAAALTAWLTTCLVLTLAALLPGEVGGLARRSRDRLTPVVVRRWVAVVLGASVGGACVLPGPAVAAVRSNGPTTEVVAPGPGWSSVPVTAPTTLPAPGFAPTDSSGSARPRPAAPVPGWSVASPRAAVRQASPPPTPGWVPRRPPTRHRTDAHLLTGRDRGGTEDAAVVVRRGDTLWSIAATRLGPEATDAEIARAWPLWHSANAAAIGGDPHHLLPGTRLVPPPRD